MITLFRSRVVSSTVLLLFFNCLLHGFRNLVLADIPEKLCPDNSSYATNSAYHDNLIELTSSMQKNASSSKFFQDSSGNYPSKVYGQYMCLNYVPDSTCQTCIVRGSEDILKLCPNKMEAVKALLESPATHYATEEKDFELGSKETLYALVQCTEDLTAHDCHKCLQEAISFVRHCCYFSLAARVLSPSCYLRYELYYFYGAAEPVKESGKIMPKLLPVIVLLLTKSVVVNIRIDSICEEAATFSSQKQGKIGGSKLSQFHRSAWQQSVCALGFFVLLDFLHHHQK
ncbi:hypothetical protein ACJRO7_021847 [Eucalyptus globulus]|uniref:Gnk2-homologous domain-containing protein n=1 Tax=Eucalyptus globulus TaxID=34317 RepID=A0ABD3KQR1_EUCGL